MKARILLATALLLTLASCTQRTSSHDEPAQGLPPRIDVESLLDFDLSMDISNLTLAELRYYRSAIYARKGYCFPEEDLRSVFSTTTWYDSLLCARCTQIEDTYSEHPADDSEWQRDYRETYAERASMYVPLQFTPEEQDFIRRVEAREAELYELNFTAPEGEIVNTANILNPWQLEEFPEQLRSALAHNGFAIVPADGIQLFHLYEQNDYNVFPSFVTTDLYLQLFHFYFDCTLREIEQNCLDSCVNALCDQLAADITRFGASTSDPAVRASAQWLQDYITIAKVLLGGQPANNAKTHADNVVTEVANCEKAENNFSAFLGYTDTMFPYSLFRPRGHYTVNERLQRYFRSMMWLQTVTFATDRPEEMHRALTLACILSHNQQTAETYRRIVEPLEFLLGKPDNVSIMQLAQEVTKLNMPAAAVLTDKHLVQQLTSRINDIAEQQTRIRPKHQLTSHNKLNLMPQRYMPDAEVLQEMVDADTNPTRRKAPRALDIMAALGSSAAERILIDELREAQRWPKYPLQLDSMRRRMNVINWKETVATRWIDALSSLTFDTDSSAGKASVPAGTPYFMLTPAWQRKCLNTALASYAELKHDAILYAKQPFGAECGGGGPPEPVIRGYVEPAIHFWRKAVALNDEFQRVLQLYDLWTEKNSAPVGSVTELARFLLACTEKELAGEPLSNADNDQIEVIGSTVEYISLDLARGADQFLMSWDDVQGPDRNMACVADVYTANMLNIPNEEKAIIYEAVGPAYELYVIVEIQGQLWLTRGAVFSYREFGQPLNLPRLNDEEWQKKLEQSPDFGVPEWMAPVTVPLTKRPTPNAEILYSSGC